MIKGRFIFLLDSQKAHDEWQRLLVAYSVEVMSVHDARLVAAMVVHGIKNTLSIYVPDFGRYSETMVLHSNEI